MDKVIGTLKAVIYLHSTSEGRAGEGWVAHGDLRGVRTFPPCALAPVLIGSSKANVLVDDDYEAVLTDFGLSYAMENSDENVDSALNVVSNVRWLAPERMPPPTILIPNAEPRAFTHTRTRESDVFSLGRTLFEVSDLLWLV